MEGHAHTAYTDGENSLQEMIEGAIKKKLEAIVFTEHVTRDACWFKDFLADIQAAQKFYHKKIRIFSGLEAKALNWRGDIDASREMTEAVDVVMGVVHRYPDCEGLFYRWEDLDYPMAAQIEYHAALGLVRKGAIDILGHLGGTCGKRFGPLPTEMTASLVKEAGKRGIAIEINYRYHSPYLPLIKLCRNYQCLVSLGSDAHRVEEVGCMHEKIQEVGCHEREDQSPYYRSWRAPGR